MHEEAREFVASLARDLGRRRFVVEFGGRDINGSVRDLFLGADYLSLDLVPGLGVDLVADAVTFMPSVAPDTVVCCSVLEHVENASGMCRNAVRILEPGGVFLMTTVADPWPAHSAVDGGPLREGEFYRNVSREDLEGWILPLVERFDVKVDAQGNVFTVGWKARRATA